jgi:hypothetical protein
MIRDVRNSVPPSSSVAPPAFDVAAVASVAGFHDSCGNVPLDTCVPVRTDAPLPARLGLRPVFVLLHVDGESSLQMISERACLPISATIEVFLQLLIAGVVVVKEEPESGSMRLAAPVPCSSAA